MSRKTRSSNTIRIILWLSMIFGGIAGGIVIDRCCFPEWWHSVSFHIISFLIGLGVMTLAFRASGAGGRALARYGREGDLPRLETNRLATEGVYGMMRHPMLVGLTLLPPGVALMLGSVGFILFIAPLEMLFIIGMMLVFDEREARAKFGAAYDDYRMRVPAVCLRLECLKALFGSQKL